VVSGGSGFCAQNDRRLHFGLGAAGPGASGTAGAGAAGAGGVPRVERAVILWPSGREQVLPAPEPGRLHVVREPG
jgi:hypothetical protein